MITEAAANRNITTNTNTTPTASVELIAWSKEDGPKGLFAAAELARAKNQKREKPHQEHHEKQRQGFYGKRKGE